MANKWQRTKFLYWQQSNMANKWQCMIVSQAQKLQGDFYRIVKIYYTAMKSLVVHRNNKKKMTQLF